MLYFGGNWSLRARCNLSPPTSPPPDRVSTWCVLIICDQIVKFNYNVIVFFCFGNLASLRKSPTADFCAACLIVLIYIFNYIYNNFLSKAYCYCTQTIYFMLI